MTTLDGFSVAIRHVVTWGEMDALGHVNNARYFAWFESARIAYFDAIGLVHDQPGAIGPILRSTSCLFHRPVKYPSELIVGTKVTKVGRSSFHMTYRAVEIDRPSEPVAEGDGVGVIVDYAAGRSVPIPDPVREAIRTIDGV